MPCEREGYPVQEEDLVHLWPTRFAHIHRYGKYEFNVEAAKARKGLRPLKAVAACSLPLISVHLLLEVLYGEMGTISQVCFPVVRDPGSLRCLQRVRYL